MSETIEFNMLANSKGVLVDLGSMRSFFSGRGMGYLLGRFDGTYRPAGPKSDLKSVDVVESALRDASLYFREPMRLLELVVVHERIVLDADALGNGLGQAVLEDSRARELILSGPFSPCSIPGGVRESVADEIERYGEGLRNLECDFSSEDKAVHDHLFECQKAGFADSTDSAYRAFYYIHLARKSGMPLVISEQKQRILGQLRRGLVALGSASHRRLTEKAMGELRGDSVWTAPLPPVQEMIIRTCCERKMRPWDACLELRASNEATAYRALVDELDRQSRAALGDRALAEKKLLKIEGHLDSWTARPGSTPTRPWRKLNLQKIPGVGWVAGAFGLFEGIPIPDLELGIGDPALVFMSDWFRPSGG